MLFTLCRLVALGLPSCSRNRKPGSGSASCALSSAVDGESTIACNEDFVVFESGVNITDVLGVDGEIVCNYTHVLTADDVNYLETVAVAKVTAKDEYDYHVEASVTEAVSFSQVTSGNKQRQLRTDHAVRT